MRARKAPELQERVDRACVLPSLDVMEAESQTACEKCQASPSLFRYELFSDKCLVKGSCCAACFLDLLRGRALSVTRRWARGSPQFRIGYTDRMALGLLSRLLFSCSGPSHAISVQELQFSEELSHRTGWLTFMFVESQDEKSRDCVTGHCDARAQLGSRHRACTSPVRRRTIQGRANNGLPC